MKISNLERILRVLFIFCIILVTLISISSQVTQVPPLLRHLQSVASSRVTQSSSLRIDTVNTNITLQPIIPISTNHTVMAISRTKNR